MKIQFCYWFPIAFSLPHQLNDTYGLENLNHIGGQDFIFVLYFVSVLCFAILFLSELFPFDFCYIPFYCFSFHLFFECYILIFGLTFLSSRLILSPLHSNSLLIFLIFLFLLSICIYTSVQARSVQENPMILTEFFVIGIFQSCFKSRLP